MNLTASRLKHVPFAAASIVVIGVIASGVIYWTNIQQQRSYLTSRDSRLLSALAAQTEGLLSDRLKIEEAAKESLRKAPAAPQDTTPAVQLDKKKREKKKEHDAPAITPFHLRIGSTRALHVTLEDSSEKELPINELLGPIFQPKINQGAFDTLAFATRGGQVAFAAGRRQRELQNVDLDALLPESNEVTPKGATSEVAATRVSFLKRYTRTATEQDVVITGVNYRMFIQPCCRLVEGASDNGAIDNGAIVVGFVESAALRSEAMAISPTLVLITLLLVVLSVVAWPFLKVGLLGSRQRVTPWDVMQLGASAIVGLAIATILALGSVNYARLSDDLDGQLEKLADQLDESLDAEIGRARAELNVMVKSMEGERAGGRSKVAGGSDYPDYSAFALVNNEGYQEVKAWPKSDPPPQNQVAERSYFKTVKNKQAWQQVRECPGCVIESLVSWTTGEPSVVLAMPNWESERPVATLTVPMRSVINPVLPPGFEFAIIDRAGTVVFHSDSQRNNYENLFLESDGNRRLKSKVMTNSEGIVGTDYWGRTYSAYVKPARVADFSVVTLFDRQSLRSLMVEWTGVSLLLLSLYFLLWVVAMGFVLGGRASWLWPDSRRGPRYVALAVFYGVLLTGFGLVAGVGGPGTPQRLGLLGFGIPILAWVVTYLVLSRRPASTTAASHFAPGIEYCAMAFLFLVITGILPGLAFVNRSYDSAIESYVKHRQFGVVHRMAGKDWLQPAATAKGCEQNSEAGCDPRGLYGRFLYRTTVERTALQSDGARPPLCTAKTHAMGTDDPLTLLEAYLPYYSDASIETRELLHDCAADGSWGSTREAGNLVLTVRPPGKPEEWNVETSMPMLTQSAGGADTPQMAVLLPGELVVLLGGLIALAYGIAVFMTHYVFLGQVIAPQWTLGRLAIAEGDTVILVGDPRTMAQQIHGAVELRLGPMLATGDADSALAQAIGTTGLLHDRPILVTDLDTGDDPDSVVAAKAGMHCLLSGLRTHAVVAVTTRPLAELAEALRVSSPDGAEAVLRLARMDGVTTLDWRGKRGAADGPLEISVAPGRQLRWRRLLLTSRRPRRVEDRETIQAGESLLRAEERAHLRLRTVCDTVRQQDVFVAGLMSREQAIEEVGDGARELYKELWSGCSDDEKVTLQHIAQFGLANAGNHRAVRQLIAKRLVTKDPDLRMMNTTFARFVLGSACQGQIEVIRGAAEPSAWDRLRTPLALGALVAGAFLFTTQRDMFNTTITALMGVSSAVPAVVRMFSLVAQKGATTPEGPSNA